MQKYSKFNKIALRIIEAFKMRQDIKKALFALLLVSLAGASTTLEGSSVNRLTQAVTTPTNCFHCVNYGSSYKWSLSANKCLQPSLQSGDQTLQTNMEGCLKGNATAVSTTPSSYTFTDINTWEYTYTVTCPTTSQTYFLQVSNDQNVNATFVPPTSSISSSIIVGALLVQSGSRDYYSSSTWKNLTSAKGSYLQIAYYCKKAVTTKYTLKFWRNLNQLSSTNQTNSSSYDQTLVKSGATLTYTYLTGNQTCVKIVYNSSQVTYLILQGQYSNQTGIPQSALTNSVTQNSCTIQNSSSNSTSTTVDMAARIESQGGQLSYMYNTNLQKTCVTAYFPSNYTYAYVIVSGRYNSSVGLPSTVLSSATYPTSCLNFASLSSNPTSSYSSYASSTWYSASYYSYYSYNGYSDYSSICGYSSSQKSGSVQFNSYYNKYECVYTKKTPVADIAVAVFFVVVIAIGMTVLFTHCLKRRKKGSAWVWKCRVATKQRRCLRKRPRSFEAHMKRQHEKANLMGNNISSSSMVTQMPTMGPTPMMMTATQIPQMVMQQPMMMQQPQVVVMPQNDMMMGPPHMMMHPQQMMNGQKVYYQ
ncbi:hypothetical protein FGO68_gene17237 [Halteria grandinella]|uniref:Uncharacterized protein n=1 Tax=Halteria grandinella TaxID=5974 RepID=A0A8J8T3W1_HALGN|nr:hypothetical protein FGO68_gene17237 [Halteria grandinella]